jgi:hypothetical protein
VTLLAAGLLLATAPSCTSQPAPYEVVGCTRENPNDWSVARIWDEQVLALIRQVVPAPGVHARNLFHVSAAMWDAWAAYDSTADGYFVTDKRQAGDVREARETAMSFAAYRILKWRYATVADLQTATAELDATMARLCLTPNYADTAAEDPAAFGNRIARTVLDRTAGDGALERERYVDSSYRSRNEPLIVAEPGTTMADPSTWQPLALDRQLSQNGLPIPGKIQQYIGPHWGDVTPFALPEPETGLPIDPGPPPRLDDPATRAAFQQAAVEVIRYSSQLDPSDGEMIDASPASLGNNTLGANDGHGHVVNPSTGQPYASQIVKRADFQRVLAEFWADGPKSETPPGHWNVVANAVADAPGFVRRIGGQGPELDPLEWDVKTYFALNGAVHDAAVAAWGVKRHYETARPISMIRYMGGLGQSSDPAAPSYDPDGLPLVPDLIELITEESVARGERHEHLADHVGDVAIRAWNGFPADPATDHSGVGWIRAAQWVPYQRSTFVTPGFAGYVSGHSTFSRAAAEVMTALTGTPYFPGGISEWTTRAGELLHEEGPTTDVALQWATYYDAADQAGLSRLFMGIHIGADDVEGRKLGAQCGIAAWELAQRYFVGDARV